LSLLDNDAERTELALRAFANLSGRFGIDHVVDLYEQQYRAALRDQAAP
jgi:hypothetical protein